jgi:tetratricopeptide (TPR) repeat protein
VGLVPPTEAMPKAKAAAERALALDPQLGEAHASLAFVHFWFDWDWPAAATEFKRAIELRPDYATARQWHAAYLQSVMPMKPSPRSVGRWNWILLSNVLRTELVALYYLEREYDRSIEQSRQILDLDPGFVLAYFNLGRSLTQKGQYRDAIAGLKKAYELSEGSAAMTMALGHAYAAAGRKADAMKMVDALTKLAKRRYVPAFYTAAIYAGLGDRERALTHLERARAARCDYLVHLPRNRPPTRSATIRASRASCLASANDNRRR